MLKICKIIAFLLTTGTTVVAKASGAGGAAGAAAAFTWHNRHNTYHANNPEEAQIMIHLCISVIIVLTLLLVVMHYGPRVWNFLKNKFQKETISKHGNKRRTKKVA